MICTTIQNKDLAGIFAVLESGDVEMAEIRIDRCRLSREDIEELFSNSDVPLVATCRIAEIREKLLYSQAEWRGDEGLDVQKAESEAAVVAESMLLAAIHAGATYVDLEMEAPPMMSKRLRRETRENGTVFVRSYHDFHGTDSMEALKALTDKCFSMGADIAKIVTTIPDDVAVSDSFAPDSATAMSSMQADAVARVLSLYDYFEPGKLIAFSMGDAGRVTRIQCIAKGAPYTYAALAEEDTAAPGQIATAEMRRMVYGDFHFISGRPSESRGMYSDADAPALSYATMTTSRPSDNQADVESSAGNGTNGVAEKADIQRTGLCTSALRSPIQMPSSKSFAQRAIMAAALAEGTSTLRGYSTCGDNEAAISVARALGAKVIVSPVHKEGKLVGDASILTIHGIGARRKTLELNSLHTGESGLLTRISIPLVAMLGQGKTVITGEGTLIHRPLKGAKEIMDAFGVRTEPAGKEKKYTSSDTIQQLENEVCKRSFHDMTDTGEVKVPLAVMGTLQPRRMTISGKGGSQLISGLLMALPLADGDSVIRLTDPKSIPYLFITIDVMRTFGVKVRCDMEGGADFAETQDWNSCKELTLRIKGRQQYRSAEMNIEGDWSSAANFLVAGAIFGSADISGLDSRSLQADISIMDILMEAGASLSQLGDNDPNGIIHVQRAPLNAFGVDASNCPDLFPIVAVLAAFCQGTSKIAGVSRLANKESDRGQAILSMLRQMGVKARISGDRMIVEGHSLPQRLLTGRLLKGGRYSSFHDHRMVMALRVAGLGADSPIEIDDTECVAKSFPSFIDLFAKLEGGLN